MTQHFTPATFKFLKELKTHNNREWFAKNKERYEEDVKGPTLRFISDFATALRKISPCFVADPRPVGGSMFRIYKDTRFSKDKTPYKTHIGAHFRHTECSKEVSAPGFYLHISPGESFGGGGIWHPSAPSLALLRQRIAEKTTKWKKVKESGEIHGGKLSRPPRGFDPNHPYIDDLKHKDFYVMRTFTEKQICSQKFIDEFAEACQGASPLVRFATNALALRWK